MTCCNHPESRHADIDYDFKDGGYVPMPRPCRDCDCGDYEIDPGERAVMRTIWKFPIPVTDYFELDMPMGADVLTVQVQRGEPQLWAVCDTTAPKVKLGFHLHGTGHPMNEDAGRYVGSFQLLGGDLVFHLFEART